MTKPTKEELERHFLQDFIEHENGLHLVVAGLESQLPPKPDAIVELSTGELLEFELTEYQLDQPAEGGSPGRRLQAFWDKVIDHLRLRLPKMQLPAEASVTLKDPADIPTGYAISFADELIDFVHEHCPKADRTTFEYQHFAGYQLLRQYVKSIDVWPTPGHLGFYWSCTDASMAYIGIVPSIITQLIQSKSAPYTWRPNATKCLLIVATHISIVSAGSPMFNPSEWTDTAMNEAALTSQFDRVYYWDYLHKWPHTLKHKKVLDNQTQSVVRSSVLTTSTEGL